MSTLVNLLPDDRSPVASVTAVVADGSERRLRRAVEPLLRVGATLGQHAEIIPYSSLMSTAHLHANVGHPRRSRAVPGETPRPTRPATTG
ncbi:hypothetical protein [Streptosporangium vulgare]|uniref:Uncharacterized protein n=1 Tax=Streptosporangium vulgare TaxID=46190 RepID=A0ABV5T4X2_9ACTN